MSAYQLPIIECTNCGQITGHLYDDYYKYLKQLIKDLEEGNALTPANYGDIYAFLNTYYTWFKREGDPRNAYGPAGVVARALLRTKELEESDLPFGSLREADNQFSMHIVRHCCLKTLLTDPTGTDV